MDEYEELSCEECSETLIEVDGQYHCPDCDSLSGFTLVPDKDEFAL